MRAPSLLLASVALLSSFAAAEPDRPKFYFPRQVKRQIWNNDSVPRTTPARTPSLTTLQDSSSTRRSLSDILSGAETSVTSRDGIFPPSSPSAAGTGLSEAGVLPPLSTSLPTSSGDGTTTVVISSTVVVGETSASAAAPTTPTTGDTSNLVSSSIDSGITFGPSGIITPSSPLTTDLPATPSAAPSTSDPIVPLILNSLESVLSSALPTFPTLTPIDSAVPTSSDAPGASAVPTPSPDLLSSIINQLTATPIPAPTSSAPGAAPTSLDPAAVPLSTGGGVVSTAADNGDLLSSIISAQPTITDLPISSITSALLGSDTIAPSVPVSNPPPPDTTPYPTDTSAPTISVPVSGPPAMPTGITAAPTIIPTNTAAPTSIISAPPIDGTDASIAAPTSTGSQVILASDTGAPLTASVSGSLMTGSVDSGTTTESVASAAASGTPLPPETIEPTGTNTGTAPWLPATILVQPTPTAPDATATTATGIPTNLPQMISPPSGIPETPADSTLIQVGFTFALNYEFVASNPTSSAQIFMFLPRGLADGLSLRLDQVTMRNLYPFDTQSTLGYITTIATVYIPSNMVTTLSVGLHQPLSPLYQDKDPSVNTIMSYINPAIPLIPGSAIVDGSSAGTGSGAAPSSSPGSGDSGVFNMQTQNSSSSTKGTTAGIAVGAIGVAAAYGAAMFFLARRYKKRRSLHRRSSSVLSPSEMRFTGSPAFMGGAVMSGGRGTPGQPNGRDSRGSGRSAGNSARTAQISAPMMAENSLGWN